MGHVQKCIVIFRDVTLHGLNLRLSNAQASQVQRT